MSLLLFKLLKYSQSCFLYLIETNTFFKSEPFAFVYDGHNSFKYPSQLLFKSDFNYDLAPYFHAINSLSYSSKFAEKFKSLYLNKFKVVPTLSLNLLMQFIERLDSEKRTDTLKSSRIIDSIICLLPEFDEKLLNNPEAKKRILIPCESDDKNILKFDTLEKLVYLIEEDDKNIIDAETLKYKIEACKQKGYSISHHKVSIRFLKKLGVHSFTQKVINISKMKINMESFGQHEHITDRFKNLLDGYKDGISIFKETIQNADDANASVVKYCYDKRTGKQYCNPNKLLDPGMISAQGPALIVYNDAKFRDQDFENLIQFGAGTKRDCRDKIGKFGLGFVTLYNVTDIPSIISNKSYVLFDPNVKFIKNLITDQQPGVRFNLANLKEADLKQFSDHFRPYDQVFGCNIFSNETFQFDGTLIRLPLRNEASKISTHIYNKESEIESLLEILYENASTMLLFTQSVRRVEFYVIEDR
jgi:sacsin